MAKSIGYNPQSQSIGSSELIPQEHASECVASLDYDPDRERLIIQFHKRGTYEYFDVPPWAFAEFNAAGSRGTYFNLYIRSQYNSERVA